MSDVLRTEEPTLTTMALAHRRNPVPFGMEPYLVMFERWRGGGGDRRERTVAQARIADENAERLRLFVEHEGLSPLVASIAEGTTLGAVGIVAAAEAARRIERMDGVVRVMKAG